MQNKENFLIFNISDADSARFRRIVIDVMTEACAIPEAEEYGGIGTLGEKQMHAAIKRYICPDVSCHEVKIDGSYGCLDCTSYCENNDDSKEQKTKKRRFVADILKEGTVYEIQTGGFSPLRSKIKWILDNTNYNIVLVHPIAETKWISLIDKKSGNIGSRKKSPLKGKIQDIASELYFISDFISSPRFSLVILMMEAEQYKKNIAGEGKRPRYRKYELIPISLLKAYIFRSVEDYKIFIPDSLPDEFTVKQYSNEAKIYNLDAYSIVKTLCGIGLLEVRGNIGRATAYGRSKSVSDRA